MSLLMIVISGVVFLLGIYLGRQVERHYQAKIILKLDGDNSDDIRDGSTPQTETELSLKAALYEKDVLLAEIHHRVKNNLQLISSLLSLKSKRVTDREAQDALRETYHRVQAIAQIHQTLYQSENLSTIQFAPYATLIARNLLSSYSQRANQIELSIQISPDILLSLPKAVPCALILNELVINAIKHGIANQEGRHIEIALCRGEDPYFHLSVANNGERLSDTFSLDHPSSMGLKLITALVDQIEGHIHFYRDPKTKFEVIFRE